MADLVERDNPEAFSALARSVAGSASALDQFLLRSTYRLEDAGHPHVRVALAGAAAALELTVPVEVYAEQGAPAATNAELVFVPDRAIVLFSGRILELLDDDELGAVAAHELAHHVLWTSEGGRYLTTARLLDAAESDARTPTAYLETARRYRLATELYADRAALLVAGGLHSAIRGLLKVSTGLSQVDPEAYLRQAAEVDFTSPSAGTTHPETVLRAWALQHWSAHPGPDADRAVSAAIGPQLELAVLDLPGQDRLRTYTLDLVASAVRVSELRAPEVLEMADQYGVVAPAEPTALADLGLEPYAEPLGLDTRRYLAAVLADLATADPDATLTSSAAALAVARGVGLGAELVRLLSTELDLSDRSRARLEESATALAGGLR